MILTAWWFLPFHDQIFDARATGSECYQELENSQASPTQDDLNEKPMTDTQVSDEINESVKSPSTIQFQTAAKVRRTEWNRNKLIKHIYALQTLQTLDAQRGLKLRPNVLPNSLYL